MWDTGYVKAQTIISTTKLSIDVNSSYGGSCVTFVKAQIGETDSWITPYYVWTHADFLSLKVLKSPQIGAILITNEGPVWHMAVIIGVENGIIKLRESNFASANVIGERELDINNEVIVGFLTPN